MSLFDDPPEIAHLPWRERERLLASARGRLWHEFRPMEIGFAVVMLACAALNGLNLIVGLKSPYALFFSGATGGIMLVSCPLFICKLIWYRKRMRQGLRDVLREQGIRPGVCFQCGTKLTANDGDTCPHCHAALVLPLCPMCGQRVPGTDDGVGRAEHVHTVSTPRSPNPI